MSLSEMNVVLKLFNSLKMPAIELISDFVLVLRDQTCRRLDISCPVQDIETYYILIKSQLRKSSSNLVGVSCVWKRKIDCFTILFNCHLKSRFCKVCDVIDVVLVSLLFT